MKKEFSKRDFIKLGLAGIGGLCVPPPLMGEPVKNLILPAEYELWKWNKEAVYYVDTPKGIKCKLCPQACKIEEGKLGDCRTRLAKDGKLYSIVYGNPCAIHVDPIEKKPLFNFLPESFAYSIATAGCNLACLNCQNWTISQKSPYETRNYNLMPGKVVDEALAAKCKSIAFTYSEPIVYYEYVYDTAKLARLNGIKNVFVSAGYINEQPLRELCKYLDAANIDLKSFNNDIYEMLNAGTLEPVLNTLKVMKEEGVWLEITNLVVPSWTDDLDGIQKMTDWLFDNGFQDTPLHFSRFHPEHKLTNLPPTPIETLTRARNIALESGLHYVYIGNVPGSDGLHTYCPNCHKKVVERQGFQIQNMHLENGKCTYCNTPIAGVWN